MPGDGLIGVYEGVCSGRQRSEGRERREPCDRLYVVYGDVRAGRLRSETGTDVYEDIEAFEAAGPCDRLRARRMPCLLGPT